MPRKVSRRKAPSRRKASRKTSKRKTSKRKTSKRCPAGTKKASYKNGRTYCKKTSRKRPASRRRSRSVSRQVVYVYQTPTYRYASPARGRVVFRKATPKRTPVGPRSPGRYQKACPSYSTAANCPRDRCMWTGNSPYVGSCLTK